MADEKVFEVEPLGLGKSVKVGSTSAATEEIIHDSRFILMDDWPNDFNPPLVSLARKFSGLVIFIWESGDDGIYRWRVDACVAEKNEKYSFLLEVKQKDGSINRTDVRIVF